MEYSHGRVNPMDTTIYPNLAGIKKSHFKLSTHISYIAIQRLFPARKMQKGHYIWLPYMH